MNSKQITNDQINSLLDKYIKYLYILDLEHPQYITNFKTVDELLSMFSHIFDYDAMSLTDVLNFRLDLSQLME